MSRLPATVETGPEFPGFTRRMPPRSTRSTRASAGSSKAQAAQPLRPEPDRRDGRSRGDARRGRPFGHSHHLFPQVIRVPLIVHLPAALARRAAIDADAVSLTTDITPTIDRALGYHPRRANPLMGRSLVDTDGDASTERRRDPLTRFENAFYCAPGRNPLYSEHAQWIPQYSVEEVMRAHAQSAARRRAAIPVRADVSSSGR